jgi:hypothetical protein
MISLAVSDLNSQAIEAILDDELFYIILDWNDSGQYWEIGVRNSAYQTLVDGISMVPNYLLFHQFKYVDLFKGDIMVGAPDSYNGPVPRDGFTSKVFEMVYIPYAELLALNVI